MKGIFAYYRPDKGFGFISTQLDGVETDLFVHRSALSYPWKHRVLDGMECEFEVGEHKGNPTAVNVQIIQTPDKFFVEGAEQKKQTQEPTETKSESGVRQ